MTLTSGRRQCVRAVYVGLAMALFFKQYGSTAAHSYSYSADQKGLAFRKVPLILKGPLLQSFRRQVLTIEYHDVPRKF